MSEVKSLSHLCAGIIGTGFIGPVHIEALKRIGVQVTAVCGSTAGAMATAEKWGIPEVYGDYDYRAMCASPNVDIVHITSPNKFHVEQSLATLSAGKHVVCEKPLGMTTAETTPLVAAAAASDRVFAGQLYVPLLPRRAANARAGAIGKARQDHPRSGALLPGLATQGDRLQLAPARRRGRQAPRRRRHRNTLDRRGVIHPGRTRGGCICHP
jgi:hypothetical protein